MAIAVVSKGVPEGKEDSITDLSHHTKVNSSMLIRIFSCSGFTGSLALIGGLDVAPGVGRFYRKDCLCDLCDLLCK